MLSYAVRKLKTIAGIMITASHNPKEYNGYKVYGEDGAQMSPEATKEVVKYIDEIKSCFSEEIKFYNEYQKHIKKVPDRIDKKYYKTILSLSLSPDEVMQEGKGIKLVYTPVHGSGYIPVTTVLKKMGIKSDATAAIPTAIATAIKRNGCLESPNPRRIALTALYPKIKNRPLKVTIQ